MANDGELSILESEDGVIALRSKPSVTIDMEDKKVGMQDLYYTFDEIIAIANKLKSIKTLTFS